MSEKPDVDPKTRVLLDMIAALKQPPLSEITPQEFRDWRARGRGFLNPQAAEITLVREDAVSGAAGPLRVRVYDKVKCDARPTLIYFHGGGFVFGDLESHDALCRRLAYYGAMRVIAVEYRLAPENQYPAAVEDAVAALNDISIRAGHFGADSSRIAVGGDSAGANLATVAARAAARSGSPQVRFQLLIYPVTQSVETTPSREQLASGYFLTRETMDWFDRH